ncbi:MAG: hypothetical protein IJX28_06405 [Clostridia bacterium]|nr:hypothetical protein [Clostridia bacterium]
MKLIKAEFAKFFSAKILSLLLLTLLAINFLVTFYLSQPNPWEDTVERVYSDYLKDPEPYEHYFKELEQMMMESIRDETPSLPHIFSGTPTYDDYQILLHVQERNAYFKNYNQTIQQVIHLTEIKIRDLQSYGYSDKTYTTKSQIELKKQYEILLDNVKLQNEYTSGYDCYLQNHIVAAFILIFLTATVSYLFLHDEDIGFGSILKTTKHGRGSTAVAKLCTTLIITALITLLFLGTTFLAVGLATGYSSPFNAIQAFEDFATVPNAMTVMEYLGLHTLHRLCAFAVYAMFIALLASLKLQYFFCFCGTAIFAGFNGFLNYRTYYGTVPAIRYLNLASMTEACSLTSFFRTVSFFKIPVRISVVLIVACFILCLLFGCVVFFAFSHDFRLFYHIGKNFSRTLKTITNQFQSLLFGIKRRIYRAHASPLWIFELKKARPLLIILIVGCLLFLRIRYVDQTIGDMESYGEALYYRYITEIQGMTEDARVNYLTDERYRIDRIKMSYDQNKEKFENGDMNSAEYTVYLETYYTVCAEEIAFNRVEQYAKDLSRSSRLAGITGDWIYTSGYESFLGLSSNLFLYVALIFLCTGSFSVEYISKNSSNGFAQILRSTKKGRNKTFISKFAVFLSLSVLLAIVFRLCDLWIVKQNYTMNASHATLLSVQSFAGITSDISIGNYIIFDLLLNAFSAAMLALIICLLSCFFKKTFAILTTSMLLTGLPELLAKTKLNNFSNCSILSFTAPQAIVYRSFEKHWLGCNWLYLIMLCAAYLLLAILLFYLAWRRFEGKTRSFIRKEKHDEA